MQPLEIYTAYGKDKIPKEIILGYTENNEKIGISKEDLNCHIYLRGGTGVGKSRTLGSLIINMLAIGKRVIFIDPLGAVYDLVLSWYAYLAREYYMSGENQFQWFTDKILPNILFLDLSKKEHNLRNNIIKPFSNEDLSDVIKRLIKFFDALFSSESGQDGLDLQLQRRSNLVALITIFAATETPLEQGRMFIYSQGFRSKLLLQASQRSSLPEVQEAVEHYRYLEEEFKGRFAEKVNSLETALSPFFENPIMRKFLLTSENNVDFQDIFENKSILIKAPVDDLPSKKILMNYFYTVFLYLSGKRPANCDHVFLGSDESAMVYNSMIADDIARIRNYKVHLIFSHQSLNQLLTQDKIKIGQTIEEQSDIKIYFRQGYEDAEKVVNNIFFPLGKCPKLIEITTTLSRNASQAFAQGISESVSQQKGTGIGYSLQEGLTQTASQNYAITDSSSWGEQISKSWAQAEGNNETNTWNIGQTFQYSEAFNIGLTQLRGQNLTFSIGEGHSLLRIETESGTLTITKTKGNTETISESNGYTDTEGISDGRSYSDGQGTTMNSHRTTGGQAITVIEGEPVAIDKPSTISKGGSLNKYKTASTTHAGHKSKAYQNLHSIANSLSNAVSRGRSFAEGRGVNLGLSNQESVSLANQFSEAETNAKQYARAIQESLGHARSLGKSSTFTKTISDANSLQISRALQQGESLALAIAKNWGANINQSTNEGITQGQQKSFTTTVGTSLSIAWRIVYYTLLEEKSLLAQEIRSLPKRVCYLSIAGWKDPVKLITDNCFLLPSIYDKYNFLKLLIEYYDKLPKNKDLKIFLSEVPKEPIKEIKVFQTLPDDFRHFFPPES